MRCFHDERGSTLRGFRRRLTLALALVAVFAASQAHAGKINGLVSSGQADRPLKFNAESPGGLFGSPASISGGVQDCAIQPNQSIAFTSNGTSNISVFDLDSGAPALAGGTNPVVASFQVHDLAISGDGRFLAACGAGTTNSPGFSLIDLANNRVELTSTFQFQNCRGVEFCGRNAYYAYQTGTGYRLNRYEVANNGALTLGGSRPFSDPIVNVTCGVRDDHPIVLIGGIDPQVLPVNANLNSVDVRRITGESPLSAAIHKPEGEDPYLVVRFDSGTNSADRLRMFRMNPATNQFRAGAIGVWVQAVGETTAPVGTGIDLVDINPRNGVVVAPSSGQVNFFAIGDGTPGAPLVAARGQVDMTGICLAPREIFGRGHFEYGVLTEWSSAVP